MISEIFKGIIMNKPLYVICILTVLSLLSCETGNYSKLTNYNNKSFSCRFVAKKRTSTNEYSSDDKLWETMINDIIDESVKSCQTEVLTGYKEKIHSTQVNDKEKMIADFSNYISTKSWAKTTVLNRNESKYNNQLCIEIELEVRPINIQTFIPGSEESEWYSVKNSNSIDEVRKFQQRFPKGNHAIDALHLIEELENYEMKIEEEKQWIQIKKSNIGQVNDVTSFIKKYPHGKHIVKARQLLKQLQEEKQWIEIKESDVEEIVDVTSFIKKYPHGKHIIEANQLLKQLQQLQENILCSTIKKLYDDEARQLLNQLQEFTPCSTTERKKTVEHINHNIKKIDQYIDEYSKGRCLKIAQNRKKDWLAIIAWIDLQCTTNTNTNNINIDKDQKIIANIKKIIAHIKEYPSGIIYTDATSKLKTLLSNLDKKIETITSIKKIIVKKQYEQDLDKTKALDRINAILQDKIKEIQMYQIEQELGLVLIKRGSFQRGSEKNYSCRCEGNEGGCVDEARKDNQHKVNISKPFYICDHEVTVSEYIKCVENKNCKSPKCDKNECPSISNWKKKDDRLNHPMNCVSWIDASDYFNWLNDNYSDILGIVFRFCTEAEWEYAALAGRINNEWICDDESQIKYYAWFRDNAYTNSLTNEDSHTREVKTKKPNKFRLFDMSGNVFEWVQDSMNEYSKKEQTDPVQQKIDGQKTKIRRCGAFNTQKKCMQITTRAYHDDNVRSGLNGFRICAEPISMMDESNE